MARKYSVLTNRHSVDSDNEISFQCQRCSFKAKDTSSMTNHIRLTHKVGDCNKGVVDSSRGPNVFIEVESLKNERFIWQNSSSLKFLSGSAPAVDELHVPEKIEFISEDASATSYLGNVQDSFESERIKNDPEFKIKKDFGELEQHKEKPENRLWYWNSTYDENNNDLSVLIQRQNSVAITEKFQNFMVKNYISVGKNIPDIVELKVDNTNIFNFDFHVCPICEQKFENYLTLTNHLVICGDKPLLFCSYCPYKIKYDDGIKHHIKKKHFPNSLIECPRCYKKLSNRHSLKVHLSYCGKERIFKCDKCTYETNIKANLRLHISRIHEYSEQECIQCNKKFKNLPSLKAHLKCCKKNPQLLSGCLLNTINNHWKSENRCKNMHTIKGKFAKICPQCHHVLGSCNKMTCCLCTSRLLYQCRKCFKLFGEYRTLRRHTLKC